MTVDVRWRRVLPALAVIGATSAVAEGNIDWTALTNAGQNLFGAAGLHVYAHSTFLQAGPPSLVVFAVLGSLGRAGGTTLCHVAMWALGWWALGLANAGHGDRLSRRTDQTAANGDRPHLRPVWLITLIAALPALFANLPPVDARRLVLWASTLGALGVLILLPSTGRHLTRRVALSNVEWVALLTVGIFGFLAAGTAHIEDALAVTALIWASRESGRDHHLRAAVAVGLAVACKPWAIAGVPMLVRRDRPILVIRDLAVAGSITVLAWAPFILGAPATLHSASLQFPLSGLSTLTLVGLSAGAPSPHWLRSAQLLGILGAAALGRRRGAADSVAAGLCARLLLDPSSYLYYAAAAALAIAAADLNNGRKPWRLMVAVASLWLLPCLTMDAATAAVVRTAGLAVLLGSYFWVQTEPRRHRPRLPAIASERVVRTA